VYYESFKTRGEAVSREIEIKKKKSRQYIEELIFNFPKDKFMGL
jgi:predicted GIY-YIG superfamily endonuclease